MDELTLEREAALVRKVAAAMWPWYRTAFQPYRWEDATTHQRSRCMYAACTAVAAMKKESEQLATETFTRMKIRDNSHLYRHSR